MTLYFVQHGLALAKEKDPNRPLSETGRKEVETISTYLQRVGVAITKIYHSGKTRAKETAQIFADHIGDGDLHEISGMGPNDNVMEFAKGLEDGTMYIGHLPHMEKLVSYLVTGNEQTGVVKFVNGGVVCLKKHNADFHIKWYLTPFLCRS